MRLSSEFIYGGNGRKDLRAGEADVEFLDKSAVRLEVGVCYPGGAIIGEADMKIVISLLFATVAVLSASAQDTREFTDAYQRGRNLSSTDATKLENELVAQAGNILDRVELVAFYTFAHEAPATEETLKARRSHLLWMAEHEPESWLWNQRSYGSAVYVEGDRLADPEGFNAIRDQWLKHLSSDPTNERIRANAASFLQLGDPDTALRLIRAMRNPRYLGYEYALLLLGVTARDYNTGTPLFSDSNIRKGPLAEQALAELQSSSDAAVIGGAGFGLARDGAILWSQKKLDWDYSSLAKNLLQRAQALEPNRLDWFVANPTLPQPGERRAFMTIRVGGKVMESKLTHKILPRVPSGLRGTRGSVALDVAIDGDGKVIRALPQSGPTELYAISVGAVEQWEYKPTTLNGDPVIVITEVVVNYR